MESTIQIEVNIATKMFRVVDSTDYTAQGVSLATLAAKGLGTVRFNGSIVYQKLLVADPLVNLATGATTSAWVACPLDSEGNVAYGTYTCDDYSVRTALSNAAVLAVTAGTGGAGAFTLEDLDMREVFIVGDTFTISNSLSSNNGLRTITSISFASGDTTLFVSGTVNVETPAVSSRLTYSLTRATATATAVYAGCTQIVPSFTFDANCDYGLFGRLSVVDTTDVNGQTVVSRLLTVMYPSWANIANVTSSDGGIVLNALYTGTWSILNTYSLSQVMGSLIVTYTASIEDEKKVSCAGTLCGLLPCIQNLLQVHGAAVKTGFSPYQFYVDSILLNYVQAVEYKKCGEFEKYQEKVAAIDELLDASGSECLCCDNDALYAVVNATAGEVTILQELQDQIDALDVRMDAAEESITTLGGSITSLDGRLDNAEDNINTLQEGVVYVKAGVLNQTGTNAPTYVSSSETIFNTMVFTRLGVGSYRATFTPAFDATKVFPTLDTRNFLKGVRIYTESNTQIRIVTFDTATGALDDNVLLDSKLLIQFYQ